MNLLSNLNVNPQNRVAYKKTCTQVHLFTQVHTILAFIHPQIYLGKRLLPNVHFIKQVIGQTSVVSFHILRPGKKFWTKKISAFCVLNLTIRAETVLKLSHFYYKGISNSAISNKNENSKFKQEIKRFMSFSKNRWCSSGNSSR